MDNSIKYFLSNISILEKFSISWIFGLSLSLCVTNQIGDDRRGVGLLIPFFILCIFYFRNSLNKKVSHDSFSLPRKIIIYTYMIFTVLLTAFYFASIYKVSLSHWISIPTLIQNYFIGSRYISGFCLITCFFIYLFINGKNNLLKTILIRSFVVVSLLLNIIYYSNTSFTIRDTLEDIEIRFQDSHYITGWNSYWMSMKSRHLKPIWYWRTYTDKDNFNKWFSRYIKSNEFLLFSHVSPPIQSELPYIDIDMFEKSKIKFIKSYRLSPLPLSGEYRDCFDLYKVNYLE